MPILRSPMLLGSLETNLRQAASESTHERLSAATSVTDRNQTGIVIGTTQEC